MFLKVHSFFFKLYGQTFCRWTLASVGNGPSVSQSFTLNRIDKVKHYIKSKAHNHIVLRFLGKSGVKCLICVRPMSYIYKTTISR